MKFFIPFATLVTLFSLFLSPNSTKAAEISLLSSSSFINGTAVINVAAPAGAVCDIAVGSSVAAPDYRWLSQMPCVTNTVTGLPNVAKLYIRVFSSSNNYNPAFDFVLNATTASTPTSSVTPQVPYIQSPGTGTIINTPETMVSWKNVNALSYEVRVGSGAFKTTYGSYKTTNTSVNVQLPQNGKKIYVSVLAKFKYQTKSHTIYIISALPPPPAPTPVPTAEPVPVVPAPTNSSLTALWATEGGDKIAQEELRATKGTTVTNPVWNGQTVSVFGAKNEVVNFNMVLESGAKTSGPISVSLDTLTGPNGFTIKNKPATGAGLFNWNDRHIELFYIRYLEIKGLSSFMVGGYYDEQQLPPRLRSADSSRAWTTRPDHNKHYPDIAVPLELVPNFTVAAGSNQSIWADVYIPKNAPAGVYTGTVQIKENGSMVAQVPVQLTVRNFALPDMPSAKTMLYMGYGDINERYLGERFPYAADKLAQVDTLRDRHFMLAHRHKISLIDANDGALAADAPAPIWIPRLDGSLFTVANGYDGPGVGVGNNVFSIGTYGSWNWQSGGETAMRTHTNAWENWFAANSPNTERFLYLIDESGNYAQTNQWATWINNNPGPGKNLKSMATIPLHHAHEHTPQLDIPTAGMYVGETAKWQAAADYFKNTPGKDFYMYNSGRPGAGSFMIDDDGVALRVSAWSQYKKNVGRWFYWESTYYNNYQAGAGQTNVFRQAKTFGGTSGMDPIRGETGWNYSNGDGVLFYPGTDKLFPTDSYNIPGPIASLRLKFWRRGIQDVDYLTLAAKIDPVRTEQIVQSIIPKTLWEYGVDNPNDPTYRNGPVSWSPDPAVWENARQQLADIIEGK